MEPGHIYVTAAEVGAGNRAYAKKLSAIKSEHVGLSAEEIVALIRTDDPAVKAYSPFWSGFADGHVFALLVCHAPCSIDGAIYQSPPAKKRLMTFPPTT